MKIIFFGSDDFASTHLEYLLTYEHEVLACVTGPDKPQGRGMNMAISPIKQMALERQIPCLQPLSLKSQDIVDALKSYEADIFVVAAYGRLLTQEITKNTLHECTWLSSSQIPRGSTCELGHS